MDQHMVLQQIKKSCQMAKDHGQRYCLAIDGRSSAGKSTFAAMLKEKLNAQIIHMDDFYLPRELRTKKRLEEPGGNVHKERFLREVMIHLQNPRRAVVDGFSYRTFDCSTMDYGLERVFSQGNFWVVEGAYAMRPEFRRAYSESLFMDIDPQFQKKRILMRNGKDAWGNFRSKWIPMEEAYHTYFNTVNYCTYYWKAEKE